MPLIVQKLFTLRLMRRITALSVHKWTKYAVESAGLDLCLSWIGSATSPSSLIC